MSDPKTRLCLTDWDGTLRRGYTLIEWSLFLASMGQISSASVRAMKELFDAYRNSDISYEDLVGRSASCYMEAIAGIAATQVSTLALKFVSNDQSHLYSFVKPLIRDLKEASLRIVIVSGAPQEVLSAYACILDIDRAYGLQIAHDANDILVPHISANPGLRSEKLRIVSELTTSGDNPIDLALGNSDSDAPLFEHARSRIVVRTDESETPDLGGLPVEAANLLSVVRAILRKGSDG